MNDTCTQGRLEEVLARQRPRFDASGYFEFTFFLFVAAIPVLAAQSPWISAALLWNCWKPLLGRLPDELMNDPRWQTHVKSAPHGNTEISQ
jgi:hypothetical protein